VTAASGTTRRLWPHPFGEVFEDGTRTPPATINVLWRELGRDTEAIQYLERIVHALAKIDTPFVAGLRGAERRPDGRLVLVHDRFVGEDLGTALAKGALPVERAVAILRQLCRGLARAHAIGINHRALGPASVVLIHDAGHDDAVRILDFGIAGVIGDNEPKPSPLLPITPERVLGFGTHTSEDVYLVGCLGYWMLAGAPPFIDEDIEALRRRHAIEDVPALRSIAKHVPTPLARAIEDALVKDPDERTLDLAAFEHALVRAQRDAGITTPWDRELETLSERARVDGECPATSGVFQSVSGRTGKRTPSGSYRPLSSVDHAAKPANGRSVVASGPAAAADAQAGGSTPVPADAVAKMPRPKPAPSAAKMPRPRPITKVIPGAETPATGTPPTSAPSSATPPKMPPKPREPVRPLTLAPKPVEAKPVEAKQVEVKPVEAKPVEAKPVEAKPVEAKPVEMKPVEAKPVEAKLPTPSRLPSKPIGAGPKPDANSVPKPTAAPRIPPPPRLSRKTPTFAMAAEPPLAFAETPRTPERPAEATPSAATSAVGLSLEAIDALAAGLDLGPAKSEAAPETATPAESADVPAIEATPTPSVEPAPAADSTPIVASAPAFVDASVEGLERAPLRDATPSQSLTIVERRPAWMWPAVGVAALVAIVSIAFAMQGPATPDASAPATPGPVATAPAKAPTPAAQPTVAPTPDVAVASPPPVIVPVPTVATPPETETPEPPPPAITPEAKPTPREPAVDPVRQHLARAKEARKKGKRDEAIAAYQSVLRHDARNRTALRELSRMQFDAGNYDGAVRYGKQLVALSSSTTSDRVALGDAYFKLGRTADAKAQYQKAAAMGDATGKKRLAKLGG